MNPNAGRSPWQRLSQHEQRKHVYAGIVLIWAFVLCVDMYALKQRPDVREKFGLDDPQQQPQGWWSSLSWPWSSSEEQEEPEWRRAKREREAAAAEAKAAAAAAEAAAQQHASRRWWQRFQSKQ